MKWLKQAFCKHIWKNVGETDLGRWYKKPVMSILSGKIYYDVYKEMAIEQKCVLCEKTQTISQDYYVKSEL